MQELEKILEEINEIEDEYTNEDHDIMFKLGAAGIAGDIKDIIRKHINDSWIPVEEGLPEEGNTRYYPENIVTLENGDVCLGIYRNDDEEWWTKKVGEEDYFIKHCTVIAWMPLSAIEPYRPERRKHDC